MRGAACVLPELFQFNAGRHVLCPVKQNEHGAKRFAVRRGHWTGHNLLDPEGFQPIAASGAGYRRGRVQHTPPGQKIGQEMGPTFKRVVLCQRPWRTAGSGHGGDDVVLPQVAVTDSDRPVVDNRQSHASNTRETRQKPFQVLPNHDEILCLLAKLGL